MHLLTRRPPAGIAAAAAIGGPLRPKHHHHHLSHPPAPFSSQSSSGPPSAPNRSRRKGRSLLTVAMAAAASRSVRLAIVGDVHGDWCERRDGAALRALGQSSPLDAVLLVGDFGEENLPMVSALAATPPPATPPRIVILGNHDAWYSLTSKGRRRAAVRAALAEAGLPVSPKIERPQQRERRRAAESAAALEAEAAEGRWRAAGSSSGNGDNGGDDGGDDGSRKRQEGEREALAEEEEEDPAALGPGAWAQLQALCAAHAGFRHWGALPREHGEEEGSGSGSDAAALVSVVGARPFSKGGASIDDCARFYRAFYGGLSTVRHSAARVAAAAREAPRGRSLVILSHNGPSGMGAARHDPCGVDWLKSASGGDHGDVDLRMALDALSGRCGDGGRGSEDGGGDPEDPAGPSGRRHVALVVHGHMHHRLRGGGSRRMVHVDARSRTVVLNAATVPRVRWADKDDEDGDNSEGGKEGGKAAGGDGDGAALSSAATLRHFLVVELSAAEDDDDEGFGASAEVTRAEDVWVRVEEEEEEGAGGGAEDEDDGRLGGKSSISSSSRLPRAAVAQRHEVLRTARGEGDEGGVLKLAWDAAAGRWTQHVWRRRREGGKGEAAATTAAGGEKEAAAV